jgi:hypothetical protein
MNKSQVNSTFVHRGNHNAYRRSDRIGPTTAREHFIYILNKLSERVYKAKDENNAKQLSWQELQDAVDDSDPTSTISLLRECAENPTDACMEVLANYAADNKATLQEWYKPLEAFIKEYYSDELSAGEFFEQAGGRFSRHGITKKELYAMAQQSDIAGRSKMSKAELVRALRKRGRKTK